jgi:hypothetical protein
MRGILGCVLLAGACVLPVARGQAGTKPVPSSCTPQVNAGLAQFLTAHQGTTQSVDQDNVLICGTMLRNSIAQHAGHSGAGSHHVLLLKVPVSGGNGSLQVEVVTNDSLDGVVTGNTGDQVYAYGQAYVDPKPIHLAGLTLAGGVHEPHCATHKGADDGWVVVAGTKYPKGGCQGAH